MRSGLKPCVLVPYFNVARSSFVFERGKLFRIESGFYVLGNQIEVNDFKYLRAHARTRPYSYRNLQGLAYRLIF